MTLKKEKPKAEVKLKRVEPRKCKRTRVFSFIYDKKRYSLTEKQRLFCVNVLNSELTVPEAVLRSGYTVTNAEGILNYNLATVISSENLNKPSIKAYIATIYDSLGLTDFNRDRELSFMLTQRSDLPAKGKGIDMYNKMKGAYVVDSTESKVNEGLAEAIKKISDLLPD